MSGLINHDVYHTPSGQELTDTYVIDDGNVSVRKGKDDYEVRGVSNVYLNKQAYLDGMRPIDRIPIKVLSSILTPLGSVYDIILTHLKGKFPNHTVA